MVKNLNKLKNHILFYPTPSNLHYIFGLGSLLGLMLLLQCVTGILLSMHYVANVDEAFNSVERIMRDVPNGWFIRYAHMNGASAMFILLYAHIARGLFYESYKGGKHWVWVSGVILFILTAAIAFLGYVLPWGQMSYWGATVITNIISSVPGGEHIVIWVWGGYAINNWTLTRFYSLHYTLAFILLGIALIHIVILHGVGSTAPVGLPSEENVQFYPYYYLKDIASLFVFISLFLFFTLFAPNYFGHPDNYIKANPLITPTHIVPEWYFLPFYAILKSVPSKAGGALLMLLSMLILFFIPFLDRSPTASMVKPYRACACILFVTLVLLLGWLGGLPVSEVTEWPMRFFVMGYFSYFLLWLPYISSVEKKVRHVRIWKRGRCRPLCTQMLTLN